MTRGDESRSAEDVAREGDRSPPWPAWPGSLIVAYTVFVVALVGVAMYLNIAADRRGVPGLAFLTPLFEWMVQRGRDLQNYFVPTGAIAPAIGACLLLYLVFAKVRWLRADCSRAAWTPLSALRAEVVALAALTLAVVAFRFYALNQMPRDNVGEMVFSVICTSDWPTLFKVNGGAAVMAPWAPLGTIYYLLVAVLWRISGSTILTMRFASAVSSVILAQVLYWFVRRLGGPLAALLAVGLYMVSPVEMVWGRHDMFPFSYSAPVVFLLAATTYYTITRFALRYWIATALLMGATYHLFASGFAGFLIPIGVVLWLLLFDRERLKRSSWKPLLLVPGLALWVLGPSIALSLGAGDLQWLSPFDPRLASRAFRGAGWSAEALGPLMENLSYLGRRLYVGTAGDTHQTPIAIFGIVPGTYVDPVVTILATVGVVWLLVNRRRPSTPVLLSLVAAALVPGLISTADAHREAVLFPALCAIAGLTAGTALCHFAARFPNLGAVAKIVLPTALLAVLSIRMGSLYFARPLGEPPTQTIARAIHDEASPGTLLILDVPYGLAVDVAYLLFDQSLVEDFAYNTVDPDEWPKVLADPQPGFDHLFYIHTALKDRVPALQKEPWKRVVYVIHNSLDPRRKVEELKQRYGTVAVKEVQPPTWRGEYDAFTVVSVLR